MVSADGEDLEVLGRECPACGDLYAAHSLEGLAWCTEALTETIEPQAAS